MEQEKTLQIILGEALEQKNLTYEKLSAMTEIPRHYLIALQNGELNKLPAAPYVRGYIKKICEILNLNFDEIWVIYKKELNHKTSGAFDKLPINRFAIHKVNRKNIITSAIVLTFILFLSINFNNFFGKPYLNIMNPKENIIATSDPVINLMGQVNEKDKLTINDREIITDTEGNFEVIYELQPGLNTIEFKVRKILGKENSEIRQIIFELATTTDFQF